MFLTGIADESGKDIHTQIKAHKELGWDKIEVRLINGVNASTPALDEAAFDEALAAITDAGMTVAGFGSAIGNWSRPITADFKTDLEDLKLVIGRMKKCGAKYIRTMSWVQKDASEDQWRDEAYRRYTDLSKMAEDAGIILLYENCTGWASENAERMVEFIKTVDSPAVKMLYDLGNVIGHGMPDPWAFYQTLKPYIEYVHIKDAKFKGDHVESNDFTYPGEGDAQVPRILNDIIGSGYDGPISIEPHVATVVHAGGGEASPEDLYNAYIKYGSMAQKLVDDAVAAKG